LVRRRELVEGIASKVSSNCANPQRLLPARPIGGVGWSLALVAGKRI